MVVSVELTWVTLPFLCALLESNKLLKMALQALLKDSGFQIPSTSDMLEITAVLLSCHSHGSLLQASWIAHPFAYPYSASACACDWKWLGLHNTQSSQLCIMLIFHVQITLYICSGLEIISLDWTAHLQLIVYQPQKHTSAVGSVCLGLYYVPSQELMYSYSTDSVSQDILRRCVFFSYRLYAGSCRCVNCPVQAQ